MILKYKGREIEVTEGHLEVSVGYQVISANYTDGAQEDLTESECEEVEELHQGELYQNAYEHMASAAYDRAKDYAKYGE